MQRKYSYKYFSGGVGGKRKKLFKKLSAISGLLLVLQISFGSLFFVALPITSIQAVSQPDLCPAPVDMVMVMDRSGSMGYAFKCVWWDNTKWVTDYYLDKGETENMNNQIECAMKGKPGHASQWTAINPTKIDAAKEAADNFIDLMGSSDQSALVSFASDATLNKQLSGIHSETKTAINNLTVSGSTNIGDAISLGLDELKSGRANPKATKAMILLTDGKANKPNGNGYDENPADVAYAQSKAVEAASLNFKIFTIGLGDNTEINQTMLENIAATTGAQYYYSPSTGDLQSIYDAIAVKLCEYGSISGCKYSDTDNDSEISDETVTLAGWEIKLNDGSVYSQLTDSEGCYLFSGLSAGSYIVSENGQGTSTYVQTFPADKTYTINLLEGEKAPNIDFGNYLPACGNNIKDLGINGYNDEECDDGNTAGGDGCSASCLNENNVPEDKGVISGYKYEDKDGATSTDEYTGYPLANWVINLFKTGDLSNPLATTSSDINGYFSFTGLKDGVYRITEILKAGWIQILSPTEDITIDKGSESKNNYFINYRTSQEPYCGDGVKDDNEECDGRDGIGGNQSCSENCVIVNLPYCGDKICNNGETCSVCSQDCGSCGGGSNGGGSSSSSSGGGLDCFLLGNCPGATGFASTSSAPSVPEVKGEEGAPILSLTKNFDRDMANPGDEGILITIKIKNSGNLTAYNVILEDLLPVGMVFSDNKNGVEKSWNLNNLTPGEIKEINFNVDITENAVSQNYKNTAKLRADNHSPVEASDVLEVVKVKVLAETGFDPIEFISLLAILTGVSFSLFCLKRKSVKM